MNTPAHLLIGAAAFSRRDERRITAAAILGGLFPDLSLYLMAGVSMFILEISPQRVFNELYYSDTWQQVFAIDNSFVLFGALLAWAIWAKRLAWIAFSGAALLHLALDFPFHGEDARMHFWPVTDWKFESPWSYWDTRAGANIIGPLEAGLSIVASVVLWVRHTSWAFRTFVLALLALELMSSGFWRFIF